MESEEDIRIGANNIEKRHCKFAYESPLGVNKELAYRSMDLQMKDVLADTIRSCICFIGRGGINKGEYTFYIDGINRIRNHIFSGSLSGKSAGIPACGILYLAASMLSGKKTCPRIDNAEKYLSEGLKVKNARRISYIKRVDSIAYAYLIEAYHMLGDDFFILE